MTDQDRPGENDAGKGDGGPAGPSRLDWERMNSHQQMELIRKDPAGFARFLNHTTEGDR